MPQNWPKSRGQLHDRKPYGTWNLQPTQKCYSNKIISSISLFNELIQSHTHIHPRAAVFPDPGPGNRKCNIWRAEMRWRRVVVVGLGQVHVANWTMLPLMWRKPPFSFIRFRDVKTCANATGLHIHMAHANAKMKLAKYIYTHTNTQKKRGQNCV